MGFTTSFPAWIRRAVRADAAPARAFELLAGQGLAVGLAPGEGLRVDAGEVVLSRPARWLGEALVLPPAVRLAEGDAWTSAERECVTVAANEKSRVQRLSK